MAFHDGVNGELSAARDRLDGDKAHHLHGVRHDALLTFAPAVHGRRYGEITRWLSTREIPRAAAAAALAAFASCSECT